MKVIVILNRAAGSVNSKKKEALRQEIVQIFHKLEVEAEVPYVQPYEIMDFTKGVYSQFDIVVAAGGDG